MVPPAGDKRIGPTGPRGIPDSRRSRRPSRSNDESEGDLSIPVKVNEIIRKLSPAERKKVEDRAAAIIAEEMSLCIEKDGVRITTLKRNLERAQRLVRKHVKPGTSLVDELLAERRAR